MSSWNSERSQEVKPQSIVHHIGRLGSKIAKPLSKRRKRMLLKRKLEDGSLNKFSIRSVTLHESDASSILTPASFRSTSTAASLDCQSVESDENSSRGDYHTVDSDDFFSDIDEDELEDYEEEEGLFETIDQNEFLLECFLTNEQSDVLFLVHFFNQETSISTDIEHVLSMHLLESKSKCECRRIDSKSAPLFTAKLHIDPEQPTVVAIKNGKVLTKVSDISTSECTEVSEWLTRTRILQNNATADTFSGVSTCI